MQGWTSILLVVVVLGAAQMFVLAMIGALLVLAVRAPDAAALAGAAARGPLSITLQAGPSDPDGTR